MADVLLTHSYFLHFDPKEERAMKPYPPLGTLYAASVLRQCGITVALHDVMFTRSENEIVPLLHRHRPKIVVIYDDCFNYLTKMCLSRMRQAAFEITRLSKQEGSAVVVCSSDATDHVERYLNHGADFVVRGEADRTLAELAGILLGLSTRRTDEIPGVAYFTDGGLCITPKREVVSNLDEIPFPAWDLIDLPSYRSRWLKKHNHFSLNMVTTRGCPFHCNWCAKPIYGQVYHSRTPENVVEEMLHLKEFARPDHIWFADDIFGLRPGWVTKFDEILNERKAHIPFKCLSRVDLLLQEDNIQHLKDAGCQTVWVGAESGSQEVLDAMEKGTTVEQIHKATDLLHKAGIGVGFFLQFGYPGETKAEIEKTLDMVRDCKPDEIGVSVSYPLPGTKFYERVRAQLGGKQNWIDSEDLDLMFQGTYPKEYYRILHRVVHKKFSIWRGIRTAREMLREPARLGKKPLRSVASMVYHAITLPNELQKLGALERANLHNVYDQ